MSDTTNIPSVPGAPLDSPTIAATIHRQARDVALRTADLPVLESWVATWNRLMPYGWRLEAEVAGQDVEGQVRCDVKLLGPNA